MFHSLALLLALSLIFLVLCSGFDVSFIPNDENEPLPQSKKYRDSLRKLCVLISTEGAILPPEIDKKKPILEKVCLKLKKDDDNIEQGLAESKAGGSTKQTLLYLLIGAGSGYYLWNNRGWLKKTVSNLIAGKKGTAVGGDNFRGGAVATGTSPNVATLNSDASSPHSAGAAAGTGPSTTISSGNIIHNTPVVEVAADPAKVAEARAARLKRFSALNTASASTGVAE